MPIFPRLAFIVCVLLFAARAFAEPPYGRMVVFGDSLSDPGNAFVLLREVSVSPYQLIPDAPYARGGLHFSNGETWVEQLAQPLRLESSVGPALATPGVFTNYAVGSARARPGAPFDLSSQVDFFLADFAGAVPGDALYVVYVGGNDLRDAVAALAIDPSGATSLAILDAAASAIAGNVERLHAAGARRFLVPNAPNLALVPAVRAQGPALQAAAQMLSIAYNDGLASALTALDGALAGETVHRFDVFALLNQAVAAPATVGLSEIAAPCITPGVKAHAVCSRPDEYLFWDGIHPTRAGHGVLARHARAVLAAP